MLQGLQLRRLLPIFVLVGSFSWGSSVEGLRYIPIFDALVVKAAKSSPPHIAFEESLDGSSAERDPWKRFEKLPAVQLSSSTIVAGPVLAEHLVLDEMVFSKDGKTEIVASAERQPASDSAWMDQLGTGQVARLQEAQRRSDVLSQDWSVPTWSDMAKEVLEKSGALQQSESPAGGRVYVAGKKEDGQWKRSVPSAKVEIPGGDAAAPEGQKEEAGFLPSMPDIQEEGRISVAGPIEIQGGLAITNEHHIEIRRHDEGIPKEIGRVDIQTGTYQIDIDSKSGTLVAQLVGRDGKVWGEGHVRLAQLADSNSRVSGPALQIEPVISYSGTVANVYSSGPIQSAPKQTLATFIKGLSEMPAKTDGSLHMSNVAKGSTTVLRAAAPGFWQTAQVIVSGEEFKSELFPTSMLKALVDIVSEKRQMSFDGAPTVVWGEVVHNGKTMAGASVEIEGEVGLQPIYFNQFLLPDPSLKTTSDNGLFAFVDVEVGFRSLLAKQGDKILGYQNVMVELQSVAQGDIESTGRYESIPMRVYDAFAGTPQPATAVLQSLSEQVYLEQGQTRVSLPQVNRVGLMRVTPDGNDYLSARYLYNDRQDFIHIPLVQWSWVNALKSYLRINETPSTGMLIGFVPEEDFQVYLAGYEDLDPQNTVYFDMQGRILQTGKGISGGGFIIFNVPEDTHEVVVIGERTQKIYSRVMPVDPGTLGVLLVR